MVRCLTSLSGTETGEMLQVVLGAVILGILLALFLTISTAGKMQECLHFGLGTLMGVVLMFTTICHFK